MELAEQAGLEDWHAILDRLLEIRTEGVHRFGDWLMSRRHLTERLPYAQVGVQPLHVHAVFLGFLWSHFARVQFEPPQQRPGLFTFDTNRLTATDEAYAGTATLLGNGNPGDQAGAQERAVS
jgi:hypothetical protein